MTFTGKQTRLDLNTTIGPKANQIGMGMGTVIDSGNRAMKVLIINI